MKSINKFLILLAISLLSLSNANAQLFPLEGFESGSLPTGWSYATTSTGWVYQNGGDRPSGSTYHHPSTAHTGIYNVMYNTYDVAPSSSILISPAINLNSTIKPVLSFWHSQEVRQLNSKLKVYYKISSGGSWEFLEEYQNPTSTWTLREIILPDAAKVATCYIGFEATSQLGCWGMCLDDILVDERGNLPRQVASLSLIQRNSIIPSGSSTNPLGIIGIIISGNTGILPLKSISIEYSGTNINDLNLASSDFEIFYTRDTIFSPVTKLTKTYLAPVGNAITFSDLNYNLQTGENYIWICASVKQAAAHGNTADFKILQNKININELLFPGGTIDPSSYSTIEESMFVDGFEGTSLWVIDSPSPSWEIGIPTGAGTYDPSYAFSGINVLATNLSGNYPPGITPASPETATTPLIDGTFYKNINIRFKRWLSFNFQDYTSIQSSVDGGTNWVELWRNAGLTEDQNWKSINISISNLATRKSDIRVRFSLNSTAEAGYFGGWNIDNFAVTGDFIAKDVGVSGITSPVNHCGMTSAETVTVKIKNFGGATVNSPFDVGFSLDNGVSYTRQNITPTIIVGAEYTHIFMVPANLSQPGLKQLKFKTFLSGDEDLTNDTYSTSMFVYPVLNYVYQNSFETSNGYWNPSGTNSTWAWGIPSATLINTASDGTKAWVTNLRGNHAISEVSYLESPCFDFTSSSDYVMFSFDYFVNALFLTNGFRLEYSINGGTDWNLVPAADPAVTLNWNPTSPTSITTLGSVGWTSNSAGYLTAKTLLPNDVKGMSSVKFRFKFAADGSSPLEGVAIDNIKIYELPYDIGIKSLINPTSGCLIGGGTTPVTLETEIRNYGFRPLKTGLIIPIEYKLRDENVINENFEIPVGPDVDRNHSISRLSTNTFSIIAKGKHSLRINTKLSQDLDRSQDTLKPGSLAVPFKVTPFELEVTGIPGYTLGSDIAVPNPFPASISVEIDAGLNGIVPYNNYLWSTTETTRKITATSFGTYSVTVTNENGCNASDAIDVIESTNDIEIISANGLDNACTYPTPVTPQVTIKNNGPSGVGPSFSMKNIPLSIMVDGMVMVSETFTPSTDIASGNSSIYTFTNSINISTPKTYNIRIYSKINEDYNKNNDTLKITTNVYGTPVVNFPLDTIKTLTPTTITLNPGTDPAFTYLWQDNSTNPTFHITSSNSALYGVTVTDNIHSCGSASDEVFINAKDLTVLSINSPVLPSFCENSVQHVTFTVRNTGNDNILSTEVINAYYNTPNGTVYQNFTVGSTGIPVLGTKQFTFTDPLDLPIGSGYISVSANIYHYPKKSTNTVEISIEKRPQPTISFDPSPLVRIFDANPYTITPNYSSNVQSYQWKDPSGIAIDGETNSSYAIIGNPQWRTIKVTAYDDISQTGCENTATLTIIADDLAIDAIKSPGNQCVLGNNIPITITIANKGNFSYPISTPITYNVDVDGTVYTQTIPLASALAPNETRDITLTQVLDLTSKSSSSIQATVSTAQDIVTSNNVLNKTVYATGYPSITLGPNRDIHALSVDITPGTNYDTYAWSFNSTLIPAPTGITSVYAATQTGTYGVTVTDLYGCSGSSSVVLTFVVDDISFKSLDKPVIRTSLDPLDPSDANFPEDGCGLNLSEPVRVTVENTGTEPINTTIEIGFKQGATVRTQTFDLASNPLLASQTRQFDLTDQLDLSAGYVPYYVDVWAKMTGAVPDMKLNNDLITVTIDKKAPVLFVFSPSTITIPDPNINTTLDPSLGSTFTYLWNNGVTTQTNTVFLTGDYWVDLTNSVGCSKRATVHVDGRNIAVNSLVAPQTSCIADAVNVKLENTGSTIIPSGTTIHLVLRINGTVSATEDLPLSNDLAKGGTIDYTFLNQPDLTAASTYSINVTASMSDRGVSVSSSKDYSVTVYEKPAPDIGPDRIITGPTVLNAGPGFTSYLWSTLATTQTITVSTTGTYSVTVTDANGCSGSDEVFLTLDNQFDVRVNALLSPSSTPTNCYKTQGQTVTAQLTNKGSHTYASGESINVSYQINSNTPVVETMNFSSSLAYDQNLNYTFSQKALLAPGAATMVLKTIIGGVNGVASNPFSITINANPTVDLGADTIRRADAFVLTSTASSGVTYLWNTGSTNASISLPAKAYGKYWLTVTSIATGCSAKDSIIIHWPVNVETIPGSNAKVSLFPNPVNDELTIKIETDKNEAFTIDLVNPNGQIVKNIKTDRTIFYSEKINVKEYTPGLYIVRVSNDKGSATFKVIVQR